MKGRGAPLYHGLISFDVMAFRLFALRSDINNAYLYFQEALRAMEEEKALKKARRHEERRKRRQQQAVLAARLKSIAVRRREEAQRLLSVLLAGAAEAK